jgi:hypothetical protein
MIRFHENLRISVKKHHPGNVRGGTRPPEISQRSNRGVFAELPPPLAPINRGLSLLKFFHRSLAFFRTLVFTFAEKHLTIKCSWLQDFLKLFYGIAFFVTQFLFLLFIILVFFVLRTLFTNAVLLFFTNVVSN